VFLFAAAAGRLLEVQLARKHGVHHLVHGLHVPVTTQFLALELLEGPVDSLIDESAHGHPPSCRSAVPTCRFKYYLPTHAVKFLANSASWRTIREGSLSRVQLA